jgi:hypothetical protein
LDIGLEDNSCIKLCITAEVSPEGPYATLSHCWGAANIPTLSETSLATFKQCIPSTGLPKTFTEAVIIARRLEIRYLWIDSLCILQDSRTDWDTESALMQQVYSNSLLNIAATSSKNNFGGLFRSRDPIDLAPCSVRPEWAAIEREEFVVLDRNLWDRQFRFAPLNRRGWVIQERILAPRVLHFGETQLLWECHEMDACEMYPRGLPSILQTFNTNIKLIDPIIYATKPGIRRDIMGANTDSYDVYVLWARIVNVYTECQITKPSDKLVAIHGIAKKFEGISNDTYIAGLWKRFLAEQLFWQLGPGGGRKQVIGGSSYRPKEYRAPSWSWASVERPVYFVNSIQGTMLIKVVETLVDALNNGQINSGHIRIEGRIIHAEVAYQRLPHVHPDSPPDSLCFRIAEKIVSPLIYLDDEIPEDVIDVYVLLGRLNNGFLTCLLLRLIEGGQQGWYERFGIFELNCRADDTIVKEMETSLSLANSSLYCEGSLGSIVIV